MADENKKPLEFFNKEAAKYEAFAAGATRELARHIIDQTPPLGGASVVLDNACGTGIVAQEALVKCLATSKETPKFTCVDVAPGMVDIARDVCRRMISAYKSPESAEDITCDVMPGEDLRLPDNHFTHSFTNQGIMFFKDGPKGASEIYRTLAPGGTAVVTAWSHDLGHVQIVQEAQKAYKPDATLMRFPIAEEWYQASHIKKTLRDAGFPDVEVHEHTVWYATKTTEELTALLYGMFLNFPVGWNDEENAGFKKHLDAGVQKAVTKITRQVAGSVDKDMEELVGVPLVALVAVAKK
jgi:ubiquinone/menaquinone biosynthesis C-methylase UbiE